MCLIVVTRRLAKIAEVKSKLTSAGGFREGLKSTGQQKYSIDEKDEVVCAANCISIRVLFMLPNKLCIVC